MWKTGGLILEPLLSQVFKRKQFKSRKTLKKMAKSFLKIKLTPCIKKLPKLYSSRKEN
jgi:hypothetical protein